MAVADIAYDEPVADTRSFARWIPRLVVWAAIAALVLGWPLALADFHSQRWSHAVVLTIAALSLNVLIGYAGQISLGHQGFLGVGAFVSAYVVAVLGQPFFMGVVAGIVTGAVASLLMGVVALRVRGLYLALVTLAYGRMAQETLFNLRIFGSGAGVEAPRPSFLASDRAFYYFTLVMLALVLYVNWRFVRSKAGRAVSAIRENEQVAASYGIPVARYKLLAFVLSGAFVGLAGALFAFRNSRIDSQGLSFQLALFIVLLTVVGGLRSPAGIIVFAVFFDLLPIYISDEFGIKWSFWLLAVGPALLVVTLVLYPGGVGQQIKPLTSWLRGGPLRAHHEEFVQEGVSGRP
ncbi:MAG TPA: branched-chain amino acid ABC transporter permease [Acidimicrobiales bacterium]|nr:branched-chain amino acid ABC transporter permease [Acidimicrobiales bacterium]